jgi:hypothetical protein
LLAVCAFGSLATPGASARPSCPTVADDAGDTANIVPIADDPSDITSIDISSSRTALTARMSVVGQPTDDEAATGRMYEVYFSTGEGSYVLRATLAMGETRYELATSSSAAETGSASAGTWHVVKPVAGRVGSHSVTVTAALDHDLPLLGRRVDVFGRVWREVGGSIPTPEGDDGFIATLDDTDEAPFRVGDAGCR